MLINKKKNIKHKRKTNFSIITLNTINKNDQHMNVQILVY